MLKRKRTSIISIIVLAAFISIIIEFQAFTAPSPLVSGNIASSNNKAENRKSKSPVSSNSRSQSANIQGAREQNIYPLVMNLLQNPSKDDQFGSYQLKGVAIISDTTPESKRAIIEDLTTNTTRTYLLNAMLPDNSQLVDIELNHIILQKSGVRMRIYLHNLNTENVAEQKLCIENAPNGYKQISNTEYVVNPYQVFKGDANSLLDFAIKTYTSNGNMEGVQFSEMKKNALAKELGLRENDVLLAVNHKNVDGLLSVIKIGINAYKSDELQLEIRRGNKIIPLTYHLFWEGEGSWTPTDVLNAKPVSSLLNSVLFDYIF